MAEMIPEGQGRIIEFQITTPFAGSDVNEALPARTRWWIKCVKMWYTCDGNAADRAIRIRFGRGADLYVEIPLRELMTASNAYTICWFNGGDQPLATGGLLLGGGLPERLIVNNEIIFSTQTIAMQIGDEIDSIFIMAEEWMEPLA